VAEQVISYGSIWAVRFDKENGTGYFLELSATGAVAKILPLVLIVKSTKPVVVFVLMIGWAPAMWLNVMGVSIIMLALESPDRYGRMACAQRKARSGAEDFDGVGKLPPGGTTDWFAM
jgi:hypothetical protein